MKTTHSIEALEKNDDRKFLSKYGCNYIESLNHHLVLKRLHNAVFSFIIK